MKIIIKHSIVVIFALCGLVEACQDDNHLNKGSEDKKTFEYNSGVDEVSKQRILSPLPPLNEYSNYQSYQNEDILTDKPSDYSYEIDMQTEYMNFSKQVIDMSNTILNIHINALNEISRLKRIIRKLNIEIDTLNIDNALKSSELYELETENKNLTSTNLDLIEQSIVTENLIKPIQKKKHKYKKKYKTLKKEKIEKAPRKQ